MNPKIPEIRDFPEDSHACIELKLRHNFLAAHTIKADNTGLHLVWIMASFWT